MRTAEQIFGVELQKQALETVRSTPITKMMNVPKAKEESENLTGTCTVYGTVPVLRSGKRFWASANFFSMSTKKNDGGVFCGCATDRRDAIRQDKMRSSCAPNRIEVWPPFAQFVVLHSHYYY
jgi:hypothetical protein